MMRYTWISCQKNLNNEIPLIQDQWNEQCSKTTHGSGIPSTTKSIDFVCKKSNAFLCIKNHIDFHIEFIFMPLFSEEWFLTDRIQAQNIYKYPQAPDTLLKDSFVAVHRYTGGQRLTISPEDIKNGKNAFEKERQVWLKKAYQEIQLYLDEL